ncbi:NADP-dependent oxidoreductase [Amycolatopsis panacis]|uniref:NADP-dependent oxidoreductase n=1 Tax=Amycolatopsis panacis TaxID=2340917 RepID=A0A419I2J5_9PSEU|nr:NADP-dependent oxidoreductase [Amycolatopsis panacis]RJQ84187.1 NADP-dependent oxidoreductase [Amycolatopsis panacis]
MSSSGPRAVRLAARPHGLPTTSTWSVEGIALDPLADGEFLVKVSHISVDPAMRGWLRDVPSYIEPVAVGDIMRANAIGQVVESRHAGFSVGDAVVGLFGVTEFAVSDGTGVTRAHLDVADAPTWLGALGMTGLTAHHGLAQVGQLRGGETVLISAAAGAVGSVAGQLAAAKGCRVIGLAAGEEKARWLRTIGFDEVIDYRDDDLAARIGAAAPEGVGIFFDNVGGAVLDAGLANLARGARVVICGAISQYNEEGPVAGPSNYMALLVRRARMQGFLVFDYPALDEAAMADLVELYRSGRLIARETVIDGTVDDFGDTLLRLFDGRNTGKLVLKIS